MQNIVNAYENFIDFLKNPDVIIDYTFLWDIICMPDENLFKKGINMVIMELPHDDITDNINIICPSNHYSNTFFDGNKPTFLLLKSKIGDR